MEKKKFRLNMPLVIFFVIIVLLIVLVRKFTSYGRYITQAEIDAIPVPENAEMQNYDNIIALRTEDDGTFPEDDGLTTVLFLGNLFAEDKDSPNNPCNLFAKATGATVYNCAIEGSYMSSLNPYFQETAYPMDAFCFYWLTNIFTGNNYQIADLAYENMEEIPEELQKSIDTLKNLNFRTVDVIYIMYDGSDYLDGRNVTNAENPMDIQTFTGAMAAGISFIQEHYPWIRIVVMSPTYAFGVAEDGSYISSDSKIYGDRKLSAYVIEQSYTAGTMDVSFVDCFYGGIHEDIASDYLTDNLHLNQAGRQLVADRMQDALK
ncbi:MAG: SGNH/GDSL hydrolase family protein [Lachnospiraceae bacterium]|nr:SGNH/GDSL hydrolase family protein [Lachnospiraceae bacterium]